MHRLPIILVVVPLASADVVDLFSTMTRSFTNSSGTNGLNFAFSSGSQISSPDLGLGPIPKNASITRASLTISHVWTHWDFGISAWNPFGCIPRAGPLAFFGQASGCSDINCAEFFPIWLLSTDRRRVTLPRFPVTLLECLWRSRRSPYHRGNLLRLH
jgi:hypothetical protein